MMNNHHQPQECHLRFNPENDVAKIVSTRLQTIAEVEKILNTEIKALDEFGQENDSSEAEKFLKMYESEYLVQKAENDKKLQEMNERKNKAQKEI